MFGINTERPRRLPAALNTGRMQMNREYRNDFTRRVNAARTISEPRYGRVHLISHAAFDEFDAEAKSALKSGTIDHLDYVNCRNFIGDAVNGPRA